MYEPFFGLERRPFSATPDPSCFFSCESIQAVIDELVVCVERGQGIGILIASAGMGKTLVSQRLSTQLSDRFATVYLGNSSFPTRRSLLQAILFELGDEYSRKDEPELRHDLKSRLQSIQPGKEALVLIVDEAHLVGEELLEEVRILSDLAHEGTPLVRVILSGQHDLEERLTERAYDALNQRVSNNVFLEPLTMSESADYLQHRLQWAGGDPETVYTEEGFSIITRAAGGVPRCLNQLADHSLLLAFANDERPVNEKTVREALDDLKQLPLQFNDVSDGVSVVGFQEDEPDADDDFEAGLHDDAAHEYEDAVEEIESRDEFDSQEEQSVPPSNYETEGTYELVGSECDESSTVPAPVGETAVVEFGAPDDSSEHTESSDSESDQPVTAVIEFSADRNDDSEQQECDECDEYEEETATEHPDELAADIVQPEFDDIDVDGVEEAVQPDVGEDDEDDTIDETAWEKPVSQQSGFDKFEIEPCVDFSFEITSDNCEVVDVSDFFEAAASASSDHVGSQERVHESCDFLSSVKDIDVGDEAVSVTEDIESDSEAVSDEETLVERLDLDADDVHGSLPEPLESTATESSADTVEVMAEPDADIDAFEEQIVLDAYSLLDEPSGAGIVWNLGSREKEELAEVHSDSDDDSADRVESSGAHESVEIEQSVNSDQDDHSSFEPEESSAHDAACSAATDDDVVQEAIEIHSGDDFSEDVEMSQSDDAVSDSGPVLSLHSDETDEEATSRESEIHASIQEELGLAGSGESEADSDDHGVEEVAEDAAVERLPVRNASPDHLLDAIVPLIGEIEDLTQQPGVRSDRTSMEIEAELIETLTAAGDGIENEIGEEVLDLCLDAQMAARTTGNTAEPPEDTYESDGPVFDGDGEEGIFDVVQPELESDQPSAHFGTIERTSDKPPGSAGRSSESRPHNRLFSELRRKQQLQQDQSRSR